MALTVEIKDAKGAKVGTVDLPAEIFDVQANVPLIHQVVTAQLNAARQGTHKAKTRGEVSGGGKKPFKQKGTGRARQGSTRSPNQRHGGVAQGPVPRKYDERTPKKMISLALRSALSDRALEGKVVVVDKFGFDKPSTKDASLLLNSLGVDGKVMVVVDRDDEVAGTVACARLPVADVIFFFRRHLRKIEIGDLHFCNF